MAGAHYTIAPKYQPEELYRVESGVRKSGPWKLDVSNLTVGTYLPKFAPVEANLKTRMVTVVRNVKVVEAYAAADAKTTMKIAKNSLAYVGMIIGNGKKGAKITAIDTTNDDYDILTLEAAFAADVAVDEVLFEATAAGGTIKKNTANFVLYNPVKVDNTDPVLVTLLMGAYEVKESKLILPIAELDKVGLTSRFQFEY
jgi:hypothetical protein